MISIGVIYYSSIYEKTGAGKVVRNFSESEDLFQKYGVNDVKMYSLTPCSAGEKTVQKKTVEKNDVSRLKVRAKNLLAKTYLGSCFCIQRQWIKNGKRAVRVYKSNSKMDEDYLVFHEVFSCHAYLKYCKRNNIKKKKYILVLHTNGEVWKMIHTYFPKIRGKRYDDWLGKFSDLCLKEAEKIILVSNISRQTFDKEYPQFSNKSEVIPNGLPSDCKNVSRKFDHLRLVTVGTVNKRKNQAALIHCLKDIQDSSISLTIVGDGEMLDTCKKLAIDFSVDSQVNFLGARDDVPSILDSCNIFVMSSLDEGLPISGIEALRSGLPMILTDVGGNSELIDGNGILVKPVIEEITKAILYLDNNKSKLENMAKKSVELYEKKYSLESMIKKYCDVLISLKR